MNVAIAGAGGRMGRTLVEAVLRNADFKLAAALEIAGSPHLGKDAGELVGSACGVKVSEDIERALKGCDAMIDFTRPEGTLHHIAVCRKLGVKPVIGTTGFDDAGKKTIADAAKAIAIAMAPNFSVGVNVTFKLLETAAKSLAKGYDVEVIEAHHRLKVDAPSGTALRMGEVVAAGLGRDLNQCAIYGREGVTGERKDETIAFSTIRGGDLVGDHTVMFIGMGERLEITHRSSSRMNYATGALRAAQWVKAKQSGLYDMFDVLGFR
ncbi:MAG: 4-hydroxy-tetrahydrodipicolinate reductase [Betaproteobacteria bacterium]|nr:4-hydroxy-tetrahydrodipicolinate reductase [Betaproteobacteria bacterium]